MIEKSCRNGKNMIHISKTILKTLFHLITATLNKNPFRGLINYREILLTVGTMQPLSASRLGRFS